MPTKLSAVKHKDKRANIPTEELRDFVKDEEREPKQMLYARDPSLDPQLVWKGKDEQDAADLAVNVVPIYIQEKIHPQAIVEDVRASAAKTIEPQADLFADFNGISFEDYIDFYHHGNKWSNRMILGDSLLVMSSLAQKEGLKGQVQMIYMDPPYGIKFGSNWQVSTRKGDVKDGKLEDVTRQPEQIRAFRDTWELGIHSYLSYLRDRLMVARDLLTESGSIFVQIGDENVHLVRSLMDEVFGSENFVAQINYRSMTPLGQRGLASVYDYILWHAKEIRQHKFRSLFEEKPLEEEPEYCFLDQGGGEYRKLRREEIRDLTKEERRRVFKRSDLASSGYTPSCTFEFEFEENLIRPRSGKSWRTHPAGIQKLIINNRLFLLGERSIYFRQYHSDFPYMQFENSWNDTAAGFGEPKVYVVQTHTKLITRCMLMTTDPGDLVFDPTCGSGTTAYVAEQWGRRWITTDTSRVALALARTRLMSARYPYYLLSDSPDGVKKESEITGMPHAPALRTENDIKKGFVYKRVPHITLESIANNEEIDAIHARYQAQLDPVRHKLNSSLKKSWEEWEIPREADEKWSAQTRDAHAEWWKLRLARQKEIDASIQRRAETEYLYDQPYEDSKRIRVSGPFTAESLSPHRVLRADEERPASEYEAARESEGDFVARMLDYLKKSGVQNTFKNERLQFDRLEPYPGEWIQAAGEYRTADGKTQRVAVTIGPQYGTVGPDLVKEAAKEAVRGIGFDLLIVCGFALDPHVSEEVRRYGKLTVLTPRMNPDLLMGEGLLKKTGAANLFMVFGEPDLEVKKLADGQVQVELRGLDVYDPTTQQVRSDSTDDVACWFIDTAYNGESFFVRHAYFTGADKPYEKLRKALKAEVDEAAWSSLYSTVSRPFPKPATGKIAIKVINHYGDEVLKVAAV